MDGGQTRRRSQKIQVELDSFILFSVRSTVARDDVRGILARGRTARQGRFDSVKRVRAAVAGGVVIEQAMNIYRGILIPVFANTAA